jgi:pimeloyl-ACP methyl ester carboxylesterase
MPQPVVILIHGLWMTGREMFLLRRRLQLAGFHVERYRYPMIGTGLGDNIGKLARYLERYLADSKVDELHLIGHSLGGVLALHLLREYPDLPVDSVICLGSPLADSSAARRTMEFALGKQLVGRTLLDAVINRPVASWDGRQRVGVIAGSEPMGISHRLTDIQPPHDGIVTVAETQVPGLTEHCVVPVSHTGLVLNASVAKMCVNFLTVGSFDRS